MSQEVFEIVQRINPKAFETQFALQCAPVIAGLKTSNLLILRNEYVHLVESLLKESSVSFYYMLRGSHKTTMLIYRKNLLEGYMRSKSVSGLLEEFGYKECSLAHILEAIEKKYRMYSEKKGDFPHELGLVLGYPAEDVVGYMENNGQNALCTGYWKVYNDPISKMRRFERFEEARASFVKMISGGIDLFDIIEHYHYDLRKVI